MGPFITPKEFVKDVGNTGMTFVLNGEVLQDGHDCADDPQRA
jgi:hypothetical protein